MIGLPILAEFADHEGFDGVIFALADRVQFELVTDPDDHVPAPTAEDLLVLSLDEATTADVTSRLTEHGATEIRNGAPTVNPYWWRGGRACSSTPTGTASSSFPPARCSGRSEPVVALSGSDGRPGLMGRSLAPHGIACVRSRSGDAVSDASARSSCTLDGRPVPFVQPVPGVGFERTGSPRQAEPLRARDRV